MLKGIYYFIKPLIPRRLQISLRRQIVSRKLNTSKKIWPIDPDSFEMPVGWKGWPDGKKFAVLLTHDVDTAKGQERCLKLLDIEKELGFKSSFNFVPERYVVDPKLRHKIIENGFEVGVHGLNHDGKLYNSKEIFDQSFELYNATMQRFELLNEASKNDSIYRKVQIKAMEAQIFRMQDNLKIIQGRMDNF